jgi:hypothetical protein
MEYNRIVAITGLPGLYEIVSSKNDGALVRSVDDQTTRFISSRIHNLSHLESIEIYTTDENVNLTDVFKAMKTNGAAMPDVKDAKSIKTYFETVYPQLDFERVYNSDMKKMIKWYESLVANNIDFTVENAVAEEEEPVVAEVAAEVEAPKAKAPAKKKAAPKADAGDDAPAAEAKPKRATKKKSDDAAE